MKPTFTALIERQDEMYVSLCPELDITSQGYTIEEARANLKEAIELFFEYASIEEIKQRIKTEIYITPIEVEIGETANFVS